MPPRRRRRLLGTPRLGGRPFFSGVEPMTFRVPERYEQVSFINPLTPRPYIALVRRMAIVGDGEMGADLLVVCNDGTVFPFSGVRYRDALPDPKVPGTCWQFLDDDDEDAP
jgi:hypothetical protein